MRDRLPSMLPLSRRDLIGYGAAIAASPTVSRAGPPPHGRFVLLGTKGGPTPSKFRAPASAALMTDGELTVIDCPDGTAQQLARAGFDIAKLKRVLITHNHSDHMAGLGALLLLAWGAGLKTPVVVYGPSPIKEIVAAELTAGGADIRYRMREEGRPDLRALVTARELTGRGVVVTASSLRVTGAGVSHFTVPAFAFRFDLPGRSIVYSGDTAPTGALVDLARGAQVLVHEALFAAALDRIVDANAPNLREHLLKSHSTTEQVGQTAAAAGVGEVVLTHLVPAFTEITDQMWTEGVRRYFRGKVIVGRDLMEI